MNTIIEKRLYLEPKYLDSNFHEHLLQKLRDTIVGECTKEYGHILSIDRITEIISNEDTIFTLKFEAMTLKPEVGKILEGKVCMVFKDGIFLKVADKQKMLIPSLTLREYTYNEDTASYIKDKNKITIDSVIRGKITAVKYDKRNFSCVGTLV